MKKLKEQTTEIAVVENTKLTELAQKSGIELTKAEEEKERQRIIAEQEEKEARTKALLKAPDQEKVKVFFEQFKQLQFPELQSEAGKKMSERVNEALSVVKKLIIEDSKTLL